MRPAAQLQLTDARTDNDYIDAAHCPDDAVRCNGARACAQPAAVAKPAIALCGPTTSTAVAPPRLIEPLAFQAEPDLTHALHAAVQTATLWGSVSSQDCEQDVSKMLTRRSSLITCSTQSSIVT